MKRNKDLEKEDELINHIIETIKANTIPEDEKETLIRDIRHLAILSFNNGTFIQSLKEQRVHESHKKVLGFQLEDIYIQIRNSLNIGDSDKQAVAEIFTHFGARESKMRLDDVDDY